MKKRISRRDLLKLLAASAGAGIVGCSRRVRDDLLGMAQDLENKQFLPWLGKGESTTPPPTATNTPVPDPTAISTTEPPSTPLPPPTGARVVHVHDVDATNWDYNDPQYWNYVNQDVVHNMVDQGVMALTGTATVAEAWRSLLPDYQPGQGIAIKVNFNNTPTCSDADGQIDAVIQPVNSLIRGLKQIGVNEADIWIYDATRWIPDRFVNGCQFTGVRFFDRGCRELAGYSSTDPDASVVYHPPAGIPAPPSSKITDVLVNATYLINIPIMKRHSIAGVSLGFKHHYGTINNPRDLHEHIRVSGTIGPYYSSDYNPTVEMYNNPNIREKTILTMADGLFAALSTDSAPVLWKTFGNQTPESILISKDPVAIDCVMCDLLQAETYLPPMTDDYLKLGQEEGLGVFERGDPWGSGYDQISYHYIDL